MNVTNKMNRIITVLYKSKVTIFYSIDDCDFGLSSI